MLKQYPVTFVNRGYTKSYPEGTLLDEILKKENMGVPFVCNGLGSCGKCRVKVSGETSAPTTEEQKNLTTSDFESGIRLACQVRLLGPLDIEVPQKSSTENILQTGLKKLTQLDPLWGSTLISSPGQTGWESLTKELPFIMDPELSVLQDIALLKPESQELSMEYFNNKIISITSSNQLPLKYGLAVDIGTTTVAAYLVNLRNGAIIRTAVTYNPQASYGADLISRIQFAAEAENLTKLHELIIEAINQLISELVSGADITKEDIIQANLVGNTCMLHLLLKVSPVALGRVPFEPVFKSLIQVSSQDIKLQINRCGSVFVLPGIGGFVGSDISAGVLACQLSPEKRELLIDIGTNGEIVITGNGKMLACSTAAGPAFEGATISCGMLANAGAINDLVLSENTVALKTIGHQAPKGICGTGLIRSLVELLRAGFIEETGRWAAPVNHPNYHPEEKRFYLAKENGKLIYIAQSDIRQFQLAKSAIRTGIELLLKRLNMTPAELDHIYLAGAFGTYLKPEDAILLGILPPVPIDRIQAVGNTAGMGAVTSIISQSALRDMVAMVEKIEHIELAEEPDFSDIYTESMMFE